MPSWLSRFRHWPMAASGLLLVLLVASPVLLFPLAAGRLYRGINIAHFGTDEHYYLSRANEVLSGNPLGNPLLREGKDRRDMYFTYTERLLLTPLRRLGATYKDTVPIVNALNAVGVFILLWLIYAFVLELAGDRGLACATALAVVGGYSIVYNKALFYVDFNIYGRSFYPYVGSLCFFGYLNLLLRSLRSPSRWSLPAAGALFGLQFYLYLFAWTFTLALNATLLAVFLAARDRRGAGAVLGISLIGLALGAYNLISLLHHFLSPLGETMSYFHGAMRTHRPVMSKVGAATLALYPLYAWLRSRDKNRLFILGCIGAGWAALNQQVASGRMVQYGHYYWYFVVPLSIVAGLYMAWSLCPPAHRRSLCLAAGLLALLNTAGGQALSFPTKLHEKLEEQRFRGAFDALNLAPRPGVILTDPAWRAYLYAIFTPHDLFWSEGAVQSFMPAERIQDSLFLYVYLDRRGRKGFSRFMEAQLAPSAGPSPYADIFSYIEGYRSGLGYYAYLDKARSPDAGFLEKRRALLRELEGAYRARLPGPEPARRLLKSYHVTYVVWDRKNNPSWDLSFLKGLKPVQDDRGIVVYFFKE